MAWKAIGVASLLGLIASNFTKREGRAASTSKAAINKSYPSVGPQTSHSDSPRKAQLLLTSLSKSISTESLSQEHIIHKGTINSTPLMHAAAKGDTSKMNSYMHMVRRQDSRKMTALMYAAYYNRVEAVKLLVWDEAKMQDQTGKTALMYAAQQGSIECVHALLPFEKGMFDRDNWNALMYSAICNNMPCQDLIDVESPYLTEDNDAILKLGLASKHSKVGHNQIDEADLSIIEVNMLGITPLMEAATVGDIQGVKANIKTYRGRKDRYGTTALMYAAIGNHFECARLLRTFERREQDHEGFTALMRAAIHGNTEIIALLAADEGGILNNTRWSAIAYLVQNDHLDGLQYLLPLEGNLQEREDVGYSMFSLLEHSNNPRVQTLLQLYL